MSSPFAGTAAGWLHMLIAFFDDLASILPPDSKGARFVKEKKELVLIALDSGVPALIRAPRVKFVQSMAPYTQYLCGSDDMNITKEWIAANLDKIDFLREIDATVLWPRMTSTTQNAIITYLQRLMQMGSALDMIPAPLLNGIDRQLQKELKRMETNHTDTTPPDMNEVIKRMMGNVLPGLEVSTEQIESITKSLGGDSGKKQ